MTSRHLWGYDPKSFLRSVALWEQFLIVADLAFLSSWNSASNTSPSTGDGNADIEVLFIAAGILMLGFAFLPRRPFSVLQPSFFGNSRPDVASFRKRLGLLHLEMYQGLGPVSSDGPWNSETVTRPGHDPWSAARDRSLPRSGDP